MCFIFFYSKNSYKSRKETSFQWHAFHLSRQKQDELRENIQKNQHRALVFVYRKTISACISTRKHLKKKDIFLTDLDTNDQHIIFL